VNDELNIGSVLDVIVKNILHGLTDFVPRLLMVIAILLIGWFFARIVQKAIQVFLAKVHFDAFLERAGIVETFSRVGVREKPSSLLPRIVFYLLMIFLFQMVTQAVGLIEISEAIQSALAFVPNLVAALIILIFGNVIAQFAGKAVGTAARESGIDYASMLGKLMTALILFVVMILAIAQLKINMDIVNSVVLIVFAAFGLSLALTFGLGTREITRNIVAGFYARKSFQIGDEIEINGERGIIRSISSLVTLLERDNRSVAISNSIFLKGAGKRG
jgi:hypothetical protein